jgi:hypothetical protein
MALEVIAAGLGRTATLSMKFALERLGLGPCHHMTEVLADRRRQIPLWLDAADGRPDWDAIFSGFRATTDYPSATYWRELADYYPDAKVVLTERDPDSWYDSVNATIFRRWPQHDTSAAPDAVLMRRTIFDHIAGEVTDRAFLTDWFVRRNQAVVDGLPPARLLRFHPRDGWAPLCAFLDVPVPDVPFPKVNDRAAMGELTANHGPVSHDPVVLEHLGRHYIAQMRARAFAPPE